MWAHVLPLNLPPSRLQPRLYQTLGDAGAGPVEFLMAPGNVTVLSGTSVARITVMGLGDSCTSSVYVIDRMLLPQQLPEPLRECMDLWNTPGVPPRRTLRRLQYTFNQSMCIQFTCTLYVKTGQFICSPRVLMFHVLRPEMQRHHKCYRSKKCCI